MDKYNQRGVSAQKSEVHEAVKALGYGLFKNTFCKISPDLLCNDSNYVNVMHADGAGTKSSLAYLYWKETGDLSVWKGIAQDALVMNLDDLLCVGATDNIMLSSTIGRNKNNIPGEVIAAIIQGTEELIADLAKHDVHIYSTGGETADVGDLVMAASRAERRWATGVAVLRFVEDVQFDGSCRFVAHWLTSLMVSRIFSA